MILLPLLLPLLPLLPLLLPPLLLMILLILRLFERIISILFDYCMMMMMDGVKRRTERTEGSASILVPSTAGQNWMLIG